MNATTDSESRPASPGSGGARSRSAERLAILCFGVVAGVLSHWVVSHYVLGDQEDYRHFWALAERGALRDVLWHQRAILGSSEPVYATIAWLLSGTLPKDLVMAAFNGLLAMYLCRWMIVRRVHWLIITLTATNFYLIVLFVAAERLKFALLLLLMAEVHQRLRWVLTALALFAHVSAALLLAARFAPIGARLVRDGLLMRVRRRNLSIVVLLAATALWVGFQLQGHISAKAEAYAAGAGIALMGLVKSGIFLAISAIYAEDWRGPVIAGAPIVAASGILGPERMGMFACLVCLAFVLPYRRGLNPGVALLTAYFGIRGFVFIRRIIETGTGF